ncbi:MAG: hypothetical protein ACHQIM_07000 [Sphingobacteriales bacterium]
MKVENPIAFGLIMNEGIYLLDKDKTLSAPIPPPPPLEQKQPDNFNFMGGNKKNFLVIGYYPEQATIDDKHFIALESIIKRLGYSLDDIAIFNIAKYTGATIQQLTDFFKPQKLLLLGRQALPEGIGQLALNKPQKLNICDTLLSFSFDEMMENNENKKAFWEQMKQL